MRNDTPREKLTTTIHPDTLKLASEMGRVMHSQSGQVTSPSMGNLIDYAFMFWFINLQVEGLRDVPPGMTEEEYWGRFDRYRDKTTAAGMQMNIARTGLDSGRPPHLAPEAEAV